MTERYIGLISGTSMDAVDAALVEFTDDGPTLRRALAYPIPDALSRRLRLLADPAWRGGLRELGEIHAQVGELFAEAALHLIHQAGLGPGEITAIGSHGQTLYHHPRPPAAFSLQIGDPARIAERTGIATVADFRSRDIAAGGQGAPLVPAFHRAVFADPEEARAVLNLGGIANLTLLPCAAEGPVLGFDTGPGNTLLDRWAQRHLHRPMDINGAWAEGGRERPELLSRLMSDPYFSRPAPKSTGTEYFNLRWLEPRLEGLDLEAQDIQATLVALTAESIAQALRRHGPRTRRLLVCGGGVHNRRLMTRLAQALPGVKVESSAQAGIDPDWVEAMAFAWLARRALRGEPGNLPSVTGAAGPRVLGSLYPP